MLETLSRNNEVVIVLGPVIDSRSGFRIAIVGIGNVEHLKRLINNVREMV